MGNAQTFDLVFPAGGIDDARARTSKGLDTTDEGINVRNIDPSTGRDGGAVRAGMEKFVSGQVYDTPSGGSSGGDNPAVRAIQRIVYDSRKTKYTAVDQTADIEIVWSAKAPTGKEVQRLLTDPYGNVYGLCQYSTVAMWNASGRLIASFDLPVDHKDQRCVAFALDNTGAIYAATSLGPQTAKRALWRVKLDEFGKFYIDWTIDFEGYIPDLFFRENYLFVLEDISTREGTGGFPSQEFGTSYLKVFDSLDSGEPRLLWQRSLPYDAMQIAVREDGAMFVTCRENIYREDDFQDDDTSTPTIDWAPNMLSSATSRIWAWYDAQAIDYLAKGDDVRVWEDKSGNRRHLFFWTGDEITTELGLDPPIFHSNTLSGFAGVRFTGKSSLATADTFAINAESNLDSNQSIIPSVDGHSWTMFMVLAPKRGGRSRGCIWEQWGDAGWRLVANEGDAVDGTVDPGALRLACTKAVDCVNGPSPDQIDSGSYMNNSATKRNDVCVVCIRMGGDDEAAPSGGPSTPGGDVLGSQWRVNGVQIDRWKTTEDKIRMPSFIGYPIVEHGINGSTPADNIPEGYEGDILEIITIRDIMADTDIDLSEIEEIEGYLAHKWGVQHALDAGHPYAVSPPSASSGGPSADVPESPISIALRSEHAMVIKLSPNTGEVVWIFAGSAAGKHLVVDDEDGVFIQGFVDAAPSGGSSGDTGADGAGYDISVRKLIDDGDSWSLGWDIDVSVIPENDYRGELLLDSEGNLYVPGHNNDNSDPARRTFFKVDKDGTVEWFWDSPSGAYAGRDYDSYTFALDPKSVDYDDEDIGEPEYLYVATYFHDDGETVYKLRLVTSEVESGSPRSIEYAAVCAGDIRVINPTAGTVTTPTGGVGVLDNASENIRGTVLFGEAFFTDGESLVVYSPKEGTVVPYVPNSAGEMPRRPRLLSRWRGALWAARFDGEPHNWFISARGDPYDVDINPPVTLATQAVLGADSRAGLCPDIINALVPFDDDLAIFGCDSTIQRLTGDPMAGGVFDLVTDEVGMAMGSPWCKDPEGFLYFVGSRGGVYRMSPSGKPLLISDRRIDRRLKSVDMGLFEAQMVWNTDADGLDLFFVPRGTPSGQQVHFFWERGSIQTPFNAWWETHIDSDDLQPTSVIVGDGDSGDDRVILIGCADGYLRKWSNDAHSDDGVPIRASVTIGPMMAGMDTSMGWSWLRVLIAGDESAGNIRYEALVADEPGAVPIVPAHSGVLTPGLGSPILQRCRGQSFWLRIASLSATRRWRFERASISGWPMGKVR